MELLHRKQYFLRTLSRLNVIINNCIHHGVTVAQVCAFDMSHIMSQCGDGVRFQPLCLTVYCCQLPHELLFKVSISSAFAASYLLCLTNISYSVL